MGMEINRRRLLQLGGAGLAYSALSRTALAQQGDITLSWFGGNARADLYNRLADMFEAANGVSVRREYAPYADYFVKLNTQAVGGQLPDIVNVTHREVRGLSDRGWLVPLDDYIANGTIDLSKFPQSVIDSGKVGGTTYTISTGNSGPVLYYNEALFADAGVEPLPSAYDWAALEAKVNEFIGKLPDGYYAMSDRIKDLGMFEVFLRHKGTGMFDDEARIAFGPDLLTEWYTIWQRYRDAGGIPSAADAAQDNSVPEPQRLFATGRTALYCTNANQLHIWQAYQEPHRNDPININYLPHGTEPGISGIVGAYFGIAGNSANPDLAAQMINWWVNDPAMAEVYLNEHGRLGNSELQAMVEPMLPEPSQIVSRFLDELVPIARALPNAPTNGRDIEALFNAKADEVAFGMVSPEQGAEAFFSEAATIVEIAG